MFSCIKLIDKYKLIYMYIYVKQDIREYLNENYVRARNLNRMQFYTHQVYIECSAKT